MSSVLRSSGAARAAAAGAAAAAARAAASLALLALVVVGAARPAHAQIVLDAEVSAASAMVWRGVTTTNRPVVNPTLALTVPTRIAAVTVGAWSNAEPLHYDRATMLDSYGGAAGPLFTMHEVWVDVEREVGAAALTLGASTYLYPRAADLSTYNTVELRAGVTLADPLATTLTYYHDVGPVGGGYAELSASRDVTIRRGRAVSLAASAGWSMGQGAGADPEAIAYFARDGHTHAEASAATAFEAGRVTVAPSLHVAVATDPWAREIAPSRERRVKAWLGTSLSWSRVLRGDASAEPDAPPAR